jgi:hypothetical protein
MAIEEAIENTNAPSLKKINPPIKINK